MTDLSAFQVQALVNQVAPDVTSYQVQVLLTDAVDPTDPFAPDWLPLYAMTGQGWRPTFPRWLFDNHPPRTGPPPTVETLRVTEDGRERISEDGRSRVTEE